MTRANRLLAGSALILAIGACAGSRLPTITPEKRVELELFALRDACLALPPGVDVSAEIAAVCKALREPAGPSEGPVSGDGGPKTVGDWPLKPVTERHPEQMGTASPKDRDTADHAPDAPGAPTLAGIGPGEGNGVRKVP